MSCFLGASAVAFLKVLTSGIEFGFDFWFAGSSRAEDGTGSVGVDMFG
jgi:hypothetical protein